MEVYLPAVPAAPAHEPDNEPVLSILCEFEKNVGRADAADGCRGFASEMQHTIVRNPLALKYELYCCSIMNLCTGTQCRHQLCINEIRDLDCQS